jgi:gliding motility-associated-like protein
VTFDTTYANCFTAAFIIDSTIPHPNALFKCALNDYPPASIMGAFMDLDPRLGSSPSDRKIEWRVEGTAPCRRFVVSYFHIGAFALTPCGQNPDSAATFQMVMYESTGLIDVFLQSRFCDASTGIRCVLGIQDFSRTRAVAAPGKNATVWTASKEGYRFVPSGGGSRFVSSELLTMNLSHIAFANSSTSTPGLLDLSFPNICSSAPSTQYIVKTIFSACDNPAVQLTSMDTITVNLTGSFNPTATATNTACGPPSGTITVNVPAGATSPFRYALDGGTPIVSSAFTQTFTNVAQGPHTVVVSDGNNACASSVNITVNQTSTLTTTVTKTDVLCNGGSTGTITVTQPTTGTAPFEYSLDGITWQASNVFNGLVAGAYTVHYRESTGCQGSQPATITQPTQLTASSSAPPITTVGGTTTVTVTAAGGTAPYTGTGTFTRNAGAFTFTVTDAHGCTATTSITLTEPGCNLGLSTVVTNAGCNGGSNGTITITANGGNGGYQYSIDGVNFQSSNSFNVTANNYTVTVKDQNNCVATKNVTVDLINDLIFSKGNDTTICEGGSAQLIVTSNATSFSWTPSTALNNSSIANPVASPVTTTDYTVTAKLGGCNVNGTIKVTVNPAPVPNAGPDSDICFGQNAQLSASGGASYQWSPSTYLSSSTIPNPTVIQPRQTTKYTLHVKDANGCTSLVTDDVFVKITPPLEVTVSPKDSVVTEGDQIQLNATSIGTSYKWTNSFTLSNPDIPNPVAAMPAGSIGNIYTYIVTASTSGGCEGTASVTLKVFKGSDIYVPTGFTPNGDGKNDGFYPITVGIKRINYFRVFNRWGQMVFSSTSLNKAWDGKMDGREQPNGVYVWMVQGITSNDKVITKKGTVMLIR